MSNMKHLALGLLASLGLVACDSGTSKSDAGQPSGSPLTTQTDTGVLGEQIAGASALNLQPMPEDARQTIEDELSRLRDEIWQKQDQLEAMQGGETVAPAGEPGVSGQSEGLQREIDELKQEYAEKWEQIAQDNHVRELQEFSMQQNVQDISEIEAKFVVKHQELNSQISSLRDQEPALNEQLMQASTDYEASLQQVTEGRSTLEGRLNELGQTQSEQRQLIEQYIAAQDQLVSFDQQIKEQTDRLSGVIESKMTAELEYHEKELQKIKFMNQSPSADTVPATETQDPAFDMDELTRELVDLDLQRLKFERDVEQGMSELESLKSQREQAVQSIVQFRPQIAEQGAFDAVQIGEQWDQRFAAFQQLKEQYMEWQDQVATVETESKQLEVIEAYAERVAAEEEGTTQTVDTEQDVSSSGEQTQGGKGYEPGKDQTSPAQQQSQVQQDIESQEPPMQPQPVPEAPEVPTAQQPIPPQPAPQTPQGLPQQPSPLPEEPTLPQPIPDAPVAGPEQPVPPQTAPEVPVVGPEQPLPPPPVPEAPAAGPQAPAPIQPAPEAPVIEPQVPAPTEPTPQIPATEPVGQAPGQTAPEAPATTEPLPQQPEAQGEPVPPVAAS